MPIPDACKTFMKPPSISGKSMSNFQSKGSRVRSAKISTQVPWRLPATGWMAQPNSPASGKRAADTNRDQAGPEAFGPRLALRAGNLPNPL